jgi:hypothetical protein
MPLESAIRWSELLLGVALVQQSLEHLASHPRERGLFASRLVLAALLALGVVPFAVEAALLVTSLFVLRRFDGPYNGGSDRMTLLLLICLLASHLAPTPRWRELVLGYAAVQVVLSYAMAGWVKLREPSWRTGQALRDLFAMSAYPVSEQVRGWAPGPTGLKLLAWSIVLFESLFPLALLDAGALRFVLVAAAGFHVANAWLLGLNRFLWVWIAAYPLLLWFQSRIFPQAAHEGVRHAMMILS